MQVFAQDNRVYWKDHPTLSWDDFQGTPPADPGPEAAYAFTAFSDFSLTPKISEIKETDTGWEATVQTDSVTGGDAYFDKSKSWVVPDQKTDDLLRHEQGHFDIAEAASRSLKNTLSSLKGKESGSTKEEALNKALADLQAKAIKTRNEHLSWMQNTNNNYDDETEHGTNKEKQDEWSKKIARWLGAPSFVIPEYPLGTFSVLVVLFTALLIYKMIRRHSPLSQRSMISDKPRFLQPPKGRI